MERQNYYHVLSLVITFTQIEVEFLCKNDFTHRYLTTYAFREIVQVRAHIQIYILSSVECLILCHIYPSQLHILVYFVACFLNLFHLWAVSVNHFFRRCFLQEALRGSLEASIIPAFEMSCKAMFEQIDASFQNGLAKHTAAIQQQYDTTHSPLAITLRVCIWCLVCNLIILFVLLMSFSFPAVEDLFGLSISIHFVLRFLRKNLT